MHMSSNSANIIIEYEELDMKSVNTIHPRIQALVDQKIKEITVDMSNVKFISSLGIGMILSFGQQLLEYQGTIKLVKLSSKIHSLLSRMNVGSVVQLEQ